MRGTVRLLLVWGVVFAIALKAAAAVGAVGCGPGHPHATGSGHTSGSASLHHHVGVHVDDATRASWQEGEASLPDYVGYDKANMLASDASAPAKASLGKPKCDACAPCCAAAAPGGVAISVPLLERVYRVAAFLGARYVDVVIVLPDRPPRGLIS